MDKHVLTSELFAAANGGVCMGRDECHWCSAPCPRQYLHDDPPPHTIVQNAWGRSKAKRPGNPYMCLGCYLWRKKRVTLYFVEGGFVDGKCAENYGWWITEESATIIGKDSGPTLYEKLLNPPLIFSLSILDGSNIKNLLQLCLANSVEEIKSDTPLSFTINNIPHTYTVYELEVAIHNGVEGMEPGVRELRRILGEPPDHLKASEKKAGRPKSSDAAKGRRVIHTSGVLVH